MRALLVVSLLAFAAPAAAQAVEPPLVVLTAAGDPSLATPLAGWVRALRMPVHAARVRALGTDCWPEDAACAARLVRADGRILLARVLWERAGEVPIRDACGPIAGYRMLRTAVLDLRLLDAQGRTLAHVTRPASGTPAERRAAIPALLAALGLSS